MLPISREEKITSIVPITEFTEDEYLVMLTQNGYIKKTALAAFGKIVQWPNRHLPRRRRSTTLGTFSHRRRAASLLVPARAMAIHFRANHQQLRPLGRSTRGVRGMKLRSGDTLISMDVLSAQVTAGISTVGEEEEENLEENNTEGAVVEPGKAALGYLPSPEAATVKEYLWSNSGYKTGPAWA